MDERNDEGRKRTWTEEIEVAGGNLIERVKGLIAEGNVRELRLKAAGGQVIFEVPLTVGVLAGGAVALAAPWLAILGAIAALVARVKLEVVREGNGEMAAGGPSPPAAKAAKAAKPATAKRRPAAAAKKPAKAQSAGRRKVR
jgi:hypothetical protein